MCRVSEENEKPLKVESVTGYKAVMKVGKKYYSPCTGMEYKVGMKIPTLTKKKVHSEGRWVDMLDKAEPTYEPFMKGKTAVFKTIQDCKERLGYLLKQESYLMIKMTLGGDIHNGRYGSAHDMFVGSKLIDFKEL